MSTCLPVVTPQKTHITYICTVKKKKEEEEELKALIISEEVLSQNDFHSLENEILIWRVKVPVPFLFTRTSQDSRFSFRLQRTPGSGWPPFTHPLLDGHVPRPCSAFCPLAPREWRSLSVLFCTSVWLVPSKSLSKDWFPVYTTSLFLWYVLPKVCLSFPA